jgi:murein DD-endopeptidase MepM/ murein hydrolase activator NlpD
MSNRFYTILIVPEKSSTVKKVIIPLWVFKSASAGLAFLILLGCAMLYNYGYVMSQIGENRQLKTENRRLRQQVQVFQNKIATVESTLDRIKTFAARLKIILHIEDQGPNVSSGKLPDANAGLSGQGTDRLPSPQSLLEGSSPGALLPPPPTDVKKSAETALQPSTLQAGEWTATLPSLDPSKTEQFKEQWALENHLTKLRLEAFDTEEQLQDEYEVLFDKRAFLAALPTRQPAPGYFTSGFGIRTSPYGDRIKMHEGLDIANRLGTVIRAPADGSVTFSDSKAGYGLTLIVNHGYGIETWYGHLKSFLTKRGEKVKRGTKIALLGNSGRSTGPHVHYEVRVNGYPVDPRSYIFEDWGP